MIDCSAPPPPPRPPVDEGPGSMAEAVKMLNEQDLRYNRQTNELIRRHVEQVERVRAYERQRAVDFIVVEKARTRKRLAHNTAERDRAIALLNRLKKAICDSKEKGQCTSTDQSSKASGS